MIELTIQKHCRNCDHSRINTSGIHPLSCVKGKNTFTYSQGTSGLHLDNAAKHCDQYNPSAMVQIERRRGFKI